MVKTKIMGTQTLSAVWKHQTSDPDLSPALTTAAIHVLLPWETSKEREGGRGSEMAKKRLSLPISPPSSVPGRRFHLTHSLLPSLSDLVDGDPNL